MLQTQPITPPPCIDAQASCAPPDSANGDAGAFARALRQAGSKPSSAPAGEHPAPAAKAAQRPDVRGSASRERTAGPRAAEHPADDADAPREPADTTATAPLGIASNSAANRLDAAIRYGAPGDDDDAPSDAASIVLPEWRAMGIVPPDGNLAERSPMASAATQTQPADLRLPVEADDPADAEPLRGMRKGMLASHGRRPQAGTTASLPATTGEPRTEVPPTAAGTVTERRTEARPPGVAPVATAVSAERDGLFVAASAVALPQATVDPRPAPAHEPGAHPTAGATLGAAVGSREFAEAFGSQVVLWVRDGVQEARLQLHPAELGPVSIQIALDGSAAQVDFHAAQAQTREAIEASLPALALALRESGFTLSGGGVFGQSAGDPGARATREPAPDARAAGDSTPPSSDAGAGTQPPPRLWRRGLLDVFA